MNIYVHKLFILARVVGLEPTTNGFGVRYIAYFGFVQLDVKP